MWQPELEILPLGGGSEVGRSCILLKYRGKRILFDCGVHPAHSGVSALPLFDVVDLASIDLCLVTHFHLDHCGALPYLLCRTKFKGRTVMTSPTKALSQVVWSDYANISRQSSVRNDCNSMLSFLYTEKDISRCMSMIETMELYQEKDIDGILVRCFCAGHVVGAAMFCVEIGGVRILYTGDYSAEEDRHVPKVCVPRGFRAHVLICESTYGIQTHEPRSNREKRLLEAIEKIVVFNGGKCLMPVFALGRAQEILLMLDELWELSQYDLVKNVPMFYVSSLSDKGSKIMRDFAAGYGGSTLVRKATQGADPFELKHITQVSSINEISHVLHDNHTPCVIIAAPGMLQRGASREVFEALAPESRNGIILTGYSVKGTLADNLKMNPQTIPRIDGGGNIKLNASFENISFSAHADFTHTLDLIDALTPPTVILVHGERTEVQAIKDKLPLLRPGVTVLAPKVLQRVLLTFPAPDQVLVMPGAGKLLDAAASHIHGQADSAATVELATQPADTPCWFVSTTTHPHVLATDKDLAALLPSLSLQTLELETQLNLGDVRLDRLKEQLSEVFDVSADSNETFHIGKGAESLPIKCQCGNDASLTMTWPFSPHVDMAAMGAQIVCLMAPRCTRRFPGYFDSLQGFLSSSWEVVERQSDGTLLVKSNDASCLVNVDSGEITGDAAMRAGVSQMMALFPLMHKRRPEG